MQPKWKLILSTGALVAVIVGSAVLYRTLSSRYTLDPLPGVTPSSASSKTTSGTLPNESAPSQPEKVLAPDFAVVDADGNTTRLSDYIGTPIVLNFWASWCPPCKIEMPHFNKVWDELGDNVAFMMVNATDGGRETEATAKKYLDSKDFTFPVYFDTTREASYTYGISSLPTTLFIDAEGYLVTGARGAISEAALRKGIAMIYNEEAPEA